MNPTDTLGGLLGAGTPTTTADTSGVTPAATAADVMAASSTTPTSNIPITTTPISSAPISSTPISTPDLSGLLGNVPLLGGSTSAVSPSFDPSLFEPGGIYSPTGPAQVPPAVQQAEQDPNAQIPQAQQQAQQPRPAAPSQDEQQRVDRSGRADRAATPDGQAAGPTATPGQQQPGQKQDQAAVSPLAQLARAIAKPAQQAAPAPAAAAQQPAAGVQQPAAAAQPQPAAAPQAPRQAPAPAVAGPPTAPQAPTAQRPAVPNLLSAILNMLGLGGLAAPLQAVAQQAYPQRPLGPMTPTGGLGPYGRAVARQRAFQRRGQGGDQGGDQGDRDFSGARISPPGSTSEVSAPTADQLRATRMAGSDTPPTEGFSNVLKSERSRYGDELKNDKTKWETLGVIALEMEEDPAAVAESLLNRSNYARTSIHNMIHSGFYGPVNHGALAREIRALQRNPERATKINAGLETALRGSNLLGGATDQGSARDPNVGWRGGRVTRFNEIYNDWGGGPGGHDGAALWRRQQQQRVRQEQQQAKRGEQFAMDISRRLPTTGGPEMEAGGGMIRRGAPATEFENITEQRRRREREQQRREAVAL